MKQPYLFQGDAIAEFMEKNGLLADECGLGKTITAIEIARARWANTTHNSQHGPVLVICPKSAKQQWADEIVGQYSEDTPIDVIVTGDAGAYPEGWKLEWLFRPYRKDSFVIMHYQGVVRQQLELQRYLWAGVIVDEAHRIKNRKAQQSKAIKFINATWKLGLSGTPMHRNPADLWSILHWLYPDRFRSYWAFFEKFVDYKTNPYMFYKEIVGVKNVEEFGRVIGPLVVRRTKHDVAPDLPPKIEQTVHVEMSPPQKKLYDEVRKTKHTLVAVLDREDGSKDELLIANTLARITRLQQVLADPAMAPFNVNCPSGKLDWVREYLNDNPGVPLLVFSKFREPVIKLATEFRGALHIGGGKGEGLAAFKAGRTDLLFGTIDALGESLNLGRASRAIFLDQHWSTRAMQQAYDRIHRIDIDEPKHIIKLITPGTVDTLVAKSLVEGWDIQRLVYTALKEWEEM